jgi:hypothetical protein
MIDETVPDALCTRVAQVARAPLLLALASALRRPGACQPSGASRWNS